MATSRLRVNFERLLNVCEELASVEEDDRWRLKKVIPGLKETRDHYRVMLFQHPAQLLVLT